MPGNDSVVVQVGQLQRRLAMLHVGVAPQIYVGISHVSARHCVQQRDQPRTTPGREELGELQRRLAMLRV